LHMQGVNEPVATYKRWHDMGRQVLRGSTAKQILRPIAFKDLDKNGEPEMKIKGFKMVRCLFGVSDTEGDPLPDYEPPEWSQERALGMLAIQQVPFEGLNGNVAGHSIGREVAVNPVARYPLKTLVHEIAHVALGHTDSDNYIEYQTHRGVKEFQAEASAYLVLNELDELGKMDVSESRAYIQNWLKGELPSDFAIKSVFTTTDKILKAGRLSTVV
jgi:hypothetical protein